jgi:hypothetical protein
MEYEASEKNAFSNGNSNSARLAACYSSPSL